LSHELDSYWILAVALLVVGGFVVVGYLVTTEGMPLSAGMTTEVAAIIVFLVGAIVLLGFSEIAIALAVITAAVLAYKQPLHGLVKKLDWDDVYAGLRLLIATFIALPLLPDKPIDPWGALNPYQLWLLVILISGLSLVGYALTRWLGPGKGALVTGLAGGLVSSTAVTLSFSRQARATPQNTTVFASGILLAWAVMFGRILVLVAVVNRALLAPILIPFGVMGLIVGAFAAYYYLSDGQAKSYGNAKSDLKVANPFSLTEAAKFAAFFAVVLVAVKIAQENFSAGGVYAVAGLAGLTDVDAIALSMAEFAKSGTAQVAVTAMVTAALANTIAKCAITFLFGSASLGRLLLLATSVMLVAGVGSVFLT
jgi:uncharacterized membrane protein (DUF4010 family)